MANRGLTITQRRSLQVSGRALAQNVTPEDEYFEHNYLSGNYGGDTGSFSIQTGTVSEGAYALYANDNNAAIARSAKEPWERTNIRMTFDIYHQSGSSAGGGPTVVTSVTGISSLDGYVFYFDGDNNYTAIRRYDSGILTELDTDDSTTVPADQWVTGQVEFLSDYTITFDIAGVSLSTKDSTFSNVILGFCTLEHIYVDNILFENI